MSKKLVLFLVVFVGLFAGMYLLWAMQNGNLALVDDISYQEIVDLGSVQKGKRVTASVEVSNRSNKLIVLNGIRTSCSCSTVYVIKDGALKVSVNTLTLKPTEQKTLHTDIEVGGTPGFRQSSKIFFTKDHANGQEYPISFVYMPVTSLYTIPKELSFGLVPLSKEVKLRVELRSDGSFVDKIENIAVEHSPVLHITSDLSGDKAEHGLFNDVNQVHIDYVDIGLSVDSPVLNYTDFISLVINKVHKVQIPISFSTIDLYEFAPKAVVLPIVGSSGKFYSVSIACSRSDGQAFELIPSGVPSLFEVITSKSASQNHTISIKLNDDNATRPVDLSRFVLKFDCKFNDSITPISLPVIVLPRDNISR